MRDMRINEHKSKIRTLSSDSKIVEHILKFKHDFDFSSTTTLAFESDWRKRIIKESILTNRTLGRPINDFTDNHLSNIPSSSSSSRIFFIVFKHILNLVRDIPP